MKRSKIPVMILALMITWANSFAQQALLNHDFPDPTVIHENGKYYAYATNTVVNGKFAHIQVASSSDLIHWKDEGDALPGGAPWASKDYWAPHVLYDGKMKKYVMFFSGESAARDTGKCLGVAFSDDPAGPFIARETPLVCGEGFVNIDPMAIQDPASGKKLLYWGSGFQPIKVQELSDDWASFKSGTTPKPLILPGQEKDYDKLVEGAWVNYHKGQYYLYYSGDNCCGPHANYAVMVARADNPFGPFVRYGEKNGTGSSVILQKSVDWLAPGHNSIFSDGKGNEYIAYHAIPIDKTTLKPGGSRLLLISRIKYKKGWPFVVRDQQPAHLTTR